MAASTGKRSILSILRKNRNSLVPPVQKKIAALSRESRQLRRLEWSLQLHKQPKRLKKNPKKFRLDREWNPGLCDDRTQYSIHWTNQANWSQSRPLWVRNITDGGNDLKWNIWNVFQFKIWFISYISLHWKNCWKCLPPFVGDFF